MTKLIKVSIIDTGGEFTCGTINDDDLAYYIKSTIEDGDIGSNCELENGTEFDAVMHDNSFHLYAPNVRNAEVIIEEAFIESESDYENHDNLEFNEIFNGGINESGIKLFQSSCPADPEINEGELIVYTKKYEKRVNDTYFIKIKDDETFDPNNIYLGYVLLDEVMDFIEDEILEYFFYIPKITFESYLMSALKNTEQKFDEDNLEKDYDYEESMQEEIWMEPELTTIIKEKHKINSYSTEGKGEWENDYLKFIDSEGEILYEEGCL